MLARPKTRGDCIDGPRPCPWAGCRHSLVLNVSFVGTIKMAPEHSETCSLDVADTADADDVTLADCGKMMGLTRERVRQIEAAALAKLMRKVGAVSR